MPSPSPQWTPQQTQQYLDRMLQLDPLPNASRMLDLRFRYAGLSTGQSKQEGQSANIAERRKLVSKRLDQIRTDFWTISPLDLRKRLEALNVSDLPELKASVDRLRLLTSYQDQFQQLAKHPQREINLYNTFRRIIMLPPRKAGTVKEKYLRQLPYSEARPKVREMVKMMRDKFPALYAIESDWFKQVGQIKSRRSDENEGISIGLEIPGWVIGLVIMIIIRILLIALRGF